MIDPQGPPDPRLARLRALMAAHRGEPAPEDSLPQDDRLGRLTRLVQQIPATPGRQKVAAAVFGPTPESSGGRDFFQTPEVTALDPAKEADFQAWKRRNQVVDGPDAHYDYPGAFQAGANRDASGHLPDTFKQHGEPTFSVESQYSRGPDDGGTWKDGRYTPAGPRVMGASEMPGPTPDTGVLGYAKQYAGGIGASLAKFPPAVAIMTGRDLARSGIVAREMITGQGGAAQRTINALQKATDMEGGGMLTPIPSTVPGGSIFERAASKVDQTITGAQNRMVGKPANAGEQTGRELGETVGGLLPFLPAVMEGGGPGVQAIYNAIKGRRRPVTPPLPPPPEPQGIHSDAQPFTTEQEVVPSTPLRTLEDIQRDLAGAQQAQQEALRRGLPNLAKEYQSHVNKLIKESRTFAKPGAVEPPPGGIPPDEPPPPPSGEGVLKPKLSRGPSAAVPEIGLYNREEPAPSPLPFTPRGAAPVEPIVPPAKPTEPSFLTFKLLKPLGEHSDDELRTVLADRMERRKQIASSPGLGVETARAANAADIAALKGELKRRRTAAPVGPEASMELDALEKEAAQLDNKATRTPKQEARLKTLMAELERRDAMETPPSSHPAIDAAKAGDEAAFLKHYKPEHDEDILRELGGDDLMSLMKTGEGAVGAGLDRSLLKKLGANLYKSNLGDVITKEGIQNAVDAIRGSERGRVEVYVGGRNFHFVDTGSGMTPEVAANEFMDVGGSAKAAGSAGGYGLAKVGLLANAERFHMQTVAETPKGRFRTLISGTSDDWVNGTLHYESAPVEATTPTGTTLSITVDREFPVFSARRLIDRVRQFSRKDLHVDEMDEAGGIKPLEKPAVTLTADQQLPNADVDYYHSDEMIDRQGNWDTMPVHVLNNGLYQFSLDPRVKGRSPRFLTVDVKSKVGVEDDGYPFTTSREELKAGVDKAVTAYVKDVTLRAAKKDALHLLDAITKAPEVRGSEQHRVVDTGRSVPDHVIGDIVAAPSTRALVRGLAGAFDQISFVMERARSRILPHGSTVQGGDFASFDFGGLGLGKGYLGVNINKSALHTVAEEAGVDAGAVKQNVILINPYTIYKELAAEGADAAHLAEHTLGIIVHELVHEVTRGHTEEFAGALTRAVGVAVTEGAGARSRLVAAWTEALASPEYKDLQGKVELAWLGEKDDIFKSISDAVDGGGDGRSHDALGDAGASEGRGPVGEGAGPGREGAVPPGGAAGEAPGRVGPDVASPYGAAAGALRELKQQFLAAKTPQEKYRALRRLQKALPEKGVPFEAGDAYEGPDEPPPDRNPKYKKLSDQALLARRHEIGDRIEESASKVQFTQYSRPNQYNEASHTGTVLGKKGDQGAVGRALGRLKDDGRIYNEIEIELKARGIPEQVITDAYHAYTSAKAERLQIEQAEAERAAQEWFDQGGHIGPRLAAMLAGAGVGGTIGAGADEEHPVRGAIIGAVAGAAFGVHAARDRTAVKVGELPKPGIKDDLLQLFAPSAREGGGMEAGDVIRHRNAELAASQERAVEYLRQFRKQITKLPQAQTRQFIHDVEAGRPVHPDLQSVAAALRQILDQDREAVQRLGTGRLTQFYEDYFPHIWKDPDAARDVVKRILGRRPLEGPKAFLRRRSIISVEEGLEHGLEMVTENPLDLVLLKHREMRRYIMAQRMMADLKESGLAQFVKANERAPDGFHRLDDRVGTVFGPSIGGGSITIRGNYWAPEPVARVFNNHLSPGLRGRPIYDAYMAVGNTMNQVQLGISAFHLGFTSIDAATSKMALAIEQLAAGRPIQSLASALAVPTAPLTTIWRGTQLRYAYLHGAETEEMAQVVQGLIEGGGRVRMDSFYRNNSVESFLDAFHGRRLPGIMGHAIPAVFELAAKPVLEVVVPRQKLGVFYDLYRFELSRMPTNSTPAMRKAMARKVWNSVDNRMGQMVYDNLFWNRTVKDLAMASTRSVGWNVGTQLELGGGVYDLAHGKLTHRGAYVIALPIVVGLAGAVMTYLYTGHGPKTLKDYFLPPTGKVNEDGNEERVQLPSYIKDIISYARHPLTTLGHKAHPLLATLIDMLENKDYFGDRIRNEDAPLVKQARQVAEYLAKQFIPFGIRNVLQEQAHKQSLTTKAAPLIGITPAPRELVRSPAQQRMADYLGRRGFPERNPEEVDSARRRGRILNALKAGEITRGQVQDSVRAGALTRRQMLGIDKRAKEPPIATRFQGLKWEEAEDVYRRGTPEEQKLWWPTLWKKRANALDQLLQSGRKGPEVDSLRGLMHREHFHDSPPAGVSR